MEIFDQENEKPIYTKKQIVISWVVFFALLGLGGLGILAAALFQDNGYSNALYSTCGILGFILLAASLVWIILKFKNITMYYTSKAMEKNFNKATLTATKHIDGTLDYDKFKQNLETAKFKSISYDLYIKKFGGWWGVRKHYIFYFSSKQSIKDSQQDFMEVLDTTFKNAFFSQCLKLYFVVLEVDDKVNVDKSFKECIPLVNITPNNALSDNLSLPIIKYLVYRPSEKKIYYDDLKINYATKKAVRFIEQELPKLLEQKVS